MSEVGSEIETTTIGDVPENLVDPNHSRRKRRKKSPHGQTEGVASSAGTGDVEDVVMEDLSTADSLPADSQLSEVNQPVSKMAPVAPIARATETGQGPPVFPPATSQDTAKPQNPLPNPKPLHPFFTPGGLKRAETPVEVKSEVKAVHPFFAPGGMKKQKLAPQTDPATSLQTLSTTPQLPMETKATVANTPPDGFIRSVLSPTTKTALKVSGGMEAPWPDKQQRHVRQLSPTCTDLPVIEPLIPYRNVRKLKTKRVEISAGEDLLENLAESLNIHGYTYRLSQPNYHEEQYFRVSSTLRLPSRHIMTGPQLQEIIRKRSSARLPFPGKQLVQRVREDSVSTSDSDGNEQKNVHPALLWLYGSLYDALTPFDVGLHETALWAYKYAPQRSTEVLQVGPEVKVLRDWLAKLMVDTGYEVPGVKKKKRNVKGKDGAAYTASKGGKRKKKKRVKGDGLDDFLVESEEEQDAMDEITDPEDNGEAAPPPIFGSQTKKSSIRTGDKNASIAAQLGYLSAGKATIGGGGDGRVVNAVVISGPHGCGKTAAAYAVAKEMGFTVFEVNPGNRRSGKDLLDQVGEMSRNHLVHQQKANVLDETPFFQQRKGKGKAKQIEEVIEKAQQTQSLILLEEADLLFEEDKQFWPTVVSLMAQSKRPIVMTCNDEKLLPIESLSLHAILRMSPPSKALAVDYLLLLAANEGHLLRRVEVAHLYNVHKGDLRAMITELNFWCQMGIGDRRAGLDWILTRFPAGCDIDDSGGAKRVISENSYLAGMGWIPREEADDGVSAPGCPGRKLKEADILKEAWAEWGVDVAVDAGGQMMEIEDGAKGVQGTNVKVNHYLHAYVEAMSDVDIYAGSAMRGLEDPVLDWTEPRRPASSHVDNILGYPVLQADPWPANQTSRDTLTSMATTVRSLARLYLPKETNAFLKRPPNYASDKSQPALNQLTTQNVIDTICSRVKLAEQTSLIPSSYFRGAFSYLTTPPPSFLASHPPSTSGSGTTIITTTIHGPLDILVLDVAPYVRSIIRYETKQEEEAKANSGLLSQSGKRSTRASRMAMMQGGGRSWGRKEKWFGQRGNAVWIGNTGGEEWEKAVEEMLERKAE